MDLPVRETSQRRCIICNEEKRKKEFSREAKQCNACIYNRQVGVLAMQIKARELDNENLRLKIELCKLQMIMDGKSSLQQTSHALQTSLQNNTMDIYPIREENASYSPRPAVPIFSRIASKHQLTSEWIHEHPPDGRESLVSYYNRYSEDMKKPIHNDKFNKLVENFGYAKKSNGNFRYWTKK